MEIVPYNQLNIYIMKQVFVIIWLGQPYVFDSYSKATSWLLDKLPYLSEIEIRMSIYSRELL